MDDELFPRESSAPRRERPDAGSPEAKAVLAELRKERSTVDDMADRLGWPLDTTRQAFRALIEAMAIVDTLDRKATRTYTHSIIWEPAPNNIIGALSTQQSRP